MEFQQLHYFVMASECGNISRAAARCRIAQPAMSQQLKRLEGYLGTRLFDRLGRGVALTDAGRALLPRARRILAEVRDTEANLKREAEGCHGTLVVGAIPTLAPYLLPAALEPLQRAMPDCQISVREDLTENLVAALVENQVDCVLASTPIDSEFVEVEVLAQEELWVAMARTSVPSRKSDLTLAELRGQPTVSLDDMHCLGQQIHGFCAARDVSPRVVCQTTQLATIQEMVAMGLGVSIVPEMAAAADTSGRLRYLRLKPTPPVREIAALWRRNRTRSKAAALFVEAVAANLKKGAHSLKQSRRPA